MTVIVKQAKWQGPVGCIKPEAIPSLHVKHAMCGLSNQPSEGKRHIFCNHLWLVVSPLKSVHFTQACLSVRLWAKTNHTLAKKCILSLVACYTLRHKTSATNGGCCLSNFRIIWERSVHSISVYPLLSLVSRSRHGTGEGG